MRLPTAVFVSAVLVAACGGAEAPDDEPVTLRVAAVHGVGRLFPAAEVSGATAYAIELVYEAGDQHLSLREQDGVRVLANVESGVAATTLATQVRFQGLTRAIALDSTSLELEFADLETASLVANNLDYLGFERGPYRVEEGSQPGGMVRLRAREKRAIERIEIVAMSEKEQWRRLLARDIDVVPVSSTVYRARYQELDGLRIVEYASKQVGVGVFNVRTTDVGTRSWFVASLDREALASSACPGGGCEPSRQSVRAAEGARAPERVSILVMKDSDVLVRLARAMRLQLMEHGVDVQLAIVDLPEYVQRMSSGQFDISLIPRRVREGWRMHVLRDLKPATGLDTEAADLDAGFPLIELLYWRDFAVVEGGFCGGEPEDYTAWRWLADLYPCEGE